MKAKEKFKSLEEKITTVDKEIDEKLKEGTAVENEYIETKNQRISVFINTFNTVKNNIDTLYKKLTKSTK